MTRNENFKYLNFITIMFVMCLITSNLGAAKLMKIGEVVLPGGIIIFPMLYVLNDILTEVYGFSISRRVILTALLCNFLMAIILFIIAQLPPADFHSRHDAFNEIFSFVPKIFLASISSYFFGELLNAFTISNLKIMLKGKNFAIRAIISTCVGAFLETLIFASIAFGSFMSARQLFDFIITLTAIKVLYEVLVLPFTVYITDYLKKIENIDSYEKPSLQAVFNIK